MGVSANFFSHKQWPCCASGFPQAFQCEIQNMPTLSTYCEVALFDTVLECPESWKQPNTSHFLLQSASYCIQAYKSNILTLLNMSHLHVLVYITYISHVCAYTLPIHMRHIYWSHIQNVCHMCNINAYIHVLPSTHLCTYM